MATMSSRPTADTASIAREVSRENTPDSPVVQALRVQTANAFMLHGAKPVFADIRPDTLNIDEDNLASKLGPRTAAIVVVHYGGVAAEMDAITGVGPPAPIPPPRPFCGGMRAVWASALQYSR